MSTFKVPGPCTVDWGGADCGKTKEGLIINIRTNFIPVIDDEHGAEPADYIFGGKSATVECGFIDTSAALAVVNGIGDISSDGAGTLTIGKLAISDSVAKTLTITDRDGNTWVAAQAIPMDPSGIPLQSTKEIVLPTVFLLLPDANGQIFSTLPSYLV